MGKARLASIHEIKIPRLEVTAAAISVKLNEIFREEIEVHKLKDIDAEVRKESRIHVTTVAQAPLDSLIHHYSSWWKLKRAFATSSLYEANSFSKREDATPNVICSSVRFGNLMVKRVIQKKGILDFQVESEVEK